MDPLMLFLFHRRLNAFLEGFYDIIPKRLISIFNEQELELLISGLPNIDIEDLRANTEYHKYQATSIQVRIEGTLRDFQRSLMGLKMASRDFRRSLMALLDF